MKGIGLLPVEHRALVYFLAMNSVYRDSCPAVVEVGFYLVEHVAGNAIPQQFDK